MRVLGGKAVATCITLLLGVCFLALLALPAAASARSVRVPASQAAPTCPACPWALNVRVSDDEQIARQDQPSIAVNGQGDAYLLWRDNRSGNYDIYFSHRPAGGVWDVSVKVNDDTGTAEQRYPSIVVDRTGDAYAVWTDSRNGNTDIYFSHRPAGGLWSGNVRVNDDRGGAKQDVARIAVDPSGGAHAVWDDFRNGKWDIYYAHRPAGGVWGTNIRLDDNSGMDEDYDPSIAADASGNVHVVWTDYRNGHTGEIYFRYLPAGDTWGPLVRVDDAPPLTGHGGPSIALDASGNAYAIWEDGRNGGTDIYFSYRPAGGTWSANVKVNDDELAGSRGFVSLAVDPTGNAYAAWEDSRNGAGDFDIYFSSRPVGGVWGCNARVNDDIGTWWQDQVSLGVDWRGRAYAAWTDNRSGDWDWGVYFSYWPMLPIGDLVWQDTDGNGIQDAGEPGVGGIPVDLFATGDCGGVPTASGVTDANGDYRFCVDPGTYCAEVSDIPQGWSFTPPGQGADDAFDSDANPATGRIRNIVVVEGAGTLDEDVGLQAPVEFVPEMGTLALLAGGLSGLAGYARRLLHK